MGFNDRFWVLAILMDTGWNSSKNWAQQKGRPQMPRPPSIRASSRTPICRSSMRAWMVPARSLTKARKSTRPSEVKKNRTLFPSKLYSASTSFMSSPCWAIFSWQMAKAFFSFSLFRSRVSLSSWVALRTTGRRGAISSISSIMEFPWVQRPYSVPRVVSTMTPSPTWNCWPLGLK